MGFVEVWIVCGAVVAVPLFVYVTGLALLNKMLKKERPVAHVIHLSSRQATQCQASKDGKIS